MGKYLLASKGAVEGYNDEPLEKQSRYDVKLLMVAASRWLREMYPKYGKLTVEVRLGPCRTPGCGHGIGRHTDIDGPCAFEGCACRVFRVRMAELTPETRTWLESLEFPEEGDA